MGQTRVMTAEAATSGHPDKLCDLIADSILDAILREDRFARVSCEVMVTTGMVVVTGQITTKCYVEISSIVRDTIRRVGYEDPSLGFDYQGCAVVVMLEEQSSGVSLGVDRKGAGDQGIVIGYATDEGEGLPGGTHLMPVPAYLANRLAERLEAVRHRGRLPCLRPDGKTQVSVAYEDGRPVALTHVVVSAHHCAEVELRKIRADIRRHVVRPVLEPTGLLTPKTEILINPLGPFLEGGPKGDAGMVGRKITVDCYGAACPHGGSAFSGKDPTKPDRSGSYGARWAAKNLVAAGLASQCVVEAAYVIGLPHPVAVRVETRGTGRLPDAELETIVRERFDLSPAAIIENLDLRRPIYAATACYGHFGRSEPDFTWEDTAAAAELAHPAAGRGGKTRGRSGRAGATGAARSGSKRTRGGKR
jgi:S-adenosylmethionine synthetase